MTKKTALYEHHVSCGGQMVEFAGWMMAVNYGSQIQEHVAVRTDAGMFDVSHMTIIDVEGEGALPFLRRLVANDCGKLDEYNALYGALLNDQGGVIDDLIVYRLPQSYRCVVNASTRDKVMSWFDANADASLTFSEQDLSMVAVQGPNAIYKLQQVIGASELTDAKPFSAVAPKDYPNWLIGRTGYTGEDGAEVMLPHADAQQLWQDLVNQGVQPAGLGARDTLRLEAGLNLYGQDLDEQHTPLESNIGWTVSWEPTERNFIGRDVLVAQRGNSEFKLTGLIMRDKGVLRHGQKVVTSFGEGVITSGTFSPTIQGSIALARIPAGATGPCQVDIRGKLKDAEIVKPPFVRNGKIKVS